ncbi:hypothetical protein M8494_03040 [Serratia ureilytica]
MEHDAQAGIVRLERGQAVDHIARLGIVGGRIQAHSVAVDIQGNEVDVRQLFGFGRRDVETRNGDGRIGLGVLMIWLVGIK